MKFRTLLINIYFSVFYACAMAAVTAPGTISLKDMDQNGVADRICVETSNIISSDNTLLSDWDVHYRGTLLTVVSKSFDSSLIHIDFTGSSADTDITNFKISYSRGETDFLHLIDGNELDNINQVAVNYDEAQPALISVVFTRSIVPQGYSVSGNFVNSVKLSYSENVIVNNGSLSTGTSMATTASLGSMTSERTLSGLMNWSSLSGGDMVTNGSGDSVIEKTSDNSITIYFCPHLHAYFGSGTTAPSTPIVTPISDASAVKDANGQFISTYGPNATSDMAWDVTGPSVTQAYMLDSDNDGAIDLVDVSFSENVLDSTMSINAFSIDHDSNYAGGNAFITAISFTSNVIQPSPSNLSDDSKLSFSFPGLEGTGAKYFHVQSGYLRDLSGNRVQNSTVAGIDMAAPKLIDVVVSTSSAPVYTGISGKNVNAIDLIYSENVIVANGTLYAGNHILSDSNLGSQTTSGTISGLLTWSGGSDLIQNSANVNSIEQKSGNTIAIYYNTQSSGHYIGGSIGMAGNVVVTPISDTNAVKDASGFAVNTTNLSVNTSSANDWNLTTPTLDFAESQLSSDNLNKIGSVVLIFDKDMVDASLDPSAFSFDQDAISGGGSPEINFYAFSTNIKFNSPGGDHSNDNGLELFSDLNVVNPAFLHHNVIGLRDTYGHLFASSTNVFTLGVAQDIRLFESSQVSQAGNFIRGTGKKDLMGFAIETRYGGSANLYAMTFKLTNGQFSDFNDYQLNDPLSGNLITSVYSISGNDMTFNEPLLLNADSRTEFVLSANLVDGNSNSNIQLSLNVSDLATNEPASGNFLTAVTSPLHIISANVQNTSSSNSNLILDSRLAIGHSAYFSLSPSGNMSAEGRNDFFQIGDNFTQEVTWAADLALQGVSSIRSGAEHTMALKDGTVYVTGANDFGQSQGYTNFTMIAGLSGIDQIEAGSYSCYAYDIETDALYVWGRNHLGQLASGTTTNVSAPSQVSKPAGEITSLAAGTEHILAIISGNLYGAGSDGFDQLGGIGQQMNLTLIDESQIWETVAAGSFHSFAINAAGNIFAFGKNHKGQLGLGYQSPSEMILQEITGLGPVQDGDGGHDHSIILLDDGTVLSVGSNEQEQIGEFTGLNTLDWVNTGGYNDVTHIECGPYTSMFIRNDGSNEYVKLFGLLRTGPTNTLMVFKAYSLGNP
jgi:alpha-tubulin suppressor-like RCC1 family protein